MLAYLRQHRYEEGFTLVELLVAILIIGILAAIAVPVFMNQRKRANDADLKSSMRSIAQAYNEWAMEPSNTNQVFYTYAQRHVVNVAGADQTLMTLSPTAFMLQDLPGMNPITAKPKTLYEIVVVVNPMVSTWNIPHDEDEFCIIGRMNNSNYDHHTGVGHTASNFDKLLFWDSNLGGIKEMESLVAAHQRGERLACYEHTKQYMLAEGIT